MSMFPHTVTVYNREKTGIDPDTRRETFINHITVLHGVLLDASKGVNVRQSGMDSADAVTLYIPFDTPAEDGITHLPKRYAPPMEFGSAEDKTALWTMSLDGEGDEDSFFVKGEVVEPDLDFQDIGMKYDGVYNITKVDAKDYGRLQHWEVGGA